MKKGVIPIVAPNFWAPAHFDKNNRIVKINIDWKEFYGIMNREEQIDKLEVVLRCLKELPRAKKMAENALKNPVGLRNAGLKKE